LDREELDELIAGLIEELLDEESSAKDELDVDGLSLLESGSLADGVLLSPDDDNEGVPLSLELLSEKLPLEVGGDEELGGVEELGTDDEGVLGVELLDDGEEEPLSLELFVEELPLEVEGVDELGADDEGVLGVELLDDGAELEGILWLEELLLDELLSEPLSELLDDEELLDELEQQSQQQQPAW